MAQVSALAGCDTCDHGQLSVGAGFQCLHTAVQGGLRVIQRGLGIALDRPAPSQCLTITERLCLRPCLPGRVECARVVPLDYHQFGGQRCADDQLPFVAVGGGQSLTRADLLSCRIQLWRVVRSRQVDFGLYEMNLRQAGLVRCLVQAASGSMQSFLR